MTEEVNTEADSWQACPSGTLGRVARQVTSTNRRRAAFKALAVIAPLMLLVGLSLKFYSAPDIGCGKALGMFNAYLNNQLSATERKQVEHHLAGCEKCTRALEGLRASRSTVATSESNRAIQTLLLISKFCPQNLLAD